MASDGTIFDINDADDYTKEEIDAMLVNKADVGLSYTKSQEDALLGEKANASAMETALASKADLTSVYTKSETDTLLGNKADVGVSYTKAEEDALLADKANSTDVYTKTEADTLLADKADVGDSYTKAEDDALLADKADTADVYTKAEVDALIGGLKMFPRLDFANPVHSFTSGNLSYTAVEDCWLLGYFTAATTSCTLSIDGTTVAFNEYSWFSSGAANHAGNGVPLTFIPAGSTVTVTNAMDNIHIFKEVAS